MTSFLRLVWNVTVVVAVVFAGSLRAAFEWPAPTAWQLALGSSSAVLCSGTLAPQANPAFLPSYDNHTFSAAYLRFPEKLNIQTLSLNASRRIRQWPTGLGVSVMGDDIYSEQTMVLAIASPALDGLQVGISLNVLGISIANYGSTETLTFSVGTRWRLNPGLQLGVFSRHLINDPNIVLAPIPESFQAGILWEFKQVEFIVEWGQPANYPATLHISASLPVLEKLNLGVGIEGYPLKPSVGLQWQPDNCALTLAARRHPVLGVFTALDLVFEL